GILLGRGDGTFQIPHNYAVGIRPISVAVGDFNGDGHVDLAVANVGTPNSGSDGSLSILLGKGDGTLAAAQTYLTGSAPSSVAVADFNGDGILDLGVANHLYPNGAVTILLGNRDGTFQAGVRFPVSPYPSFVAAGDFNGDGHPDL